MNRMLYGCTPESHVVPSSPPHDRVETNQITRKAIQFNHNCINTGMCRGVVDSFIESSYSAQIRKLIFQESKTDY